MLLTIARNATCRLQTLYQAAIEADKQMHSELPVMQPAGSKHP